MEKISVDYQQLPAGLCRASWRKLWSTWPGTKLWRFRSKPRRSSSALERADQVLRDAMRGRLADDLAEEFGGYWSDGSFRSLAGELGFDLDKQSQSLISGIDIIALIAAMLRPCCASSIL